MLGRLRMSINSCIEEYRILSGDIFGHPRMAHFRSPIFWPRDKYDGKLIEHAVEKVVHRRMSAAERELGAGNFNSPPGLCRTVVFAYAEKISDDKTEYRYTEDKKSIDQEGSSPYLFRSYDHWGSGALPQSITERNPGPAHNIPIWQAARATTAAPFYFDTIEISNRKFGDGGFGTNNPAQEMYNEVSQMKGDDPSSIKLLVSIGTGESSISRIENGSFKKALGYINAARKLASDSEGVHKTMEQMKEKWEVPYHRFNVPLKFGLGKIKLDELKHDTLEKIEKDTTKYCNTIEKELELVAQILVDNRRNRSKSDMWSLVSTGKQYRCMVKKCRRTQELLPRESDLREHLKTAHENLTSSKINGYVQLGTCPPLHRSV
ncbi:hypothetical protein BP5796_11213 [Coleophoma crateriformis]|uniref:PNPLA domain-containing protein n=1 Tax=Coleophoma crateriformis TaxID=565419 RepID=A0A3D8QHY0_9HELO|nr:hypothetical protein BP5796_11213 [Coleophoma crateriformis]